MSQHGDWHALAVTVIVGSPCPATVKVASHGGNGSDTDLVTRTSAHSELDRDLELQGRNLNTCSGTVTTGDCVSTLQPAAYWLLGTPTSGSPGSELGP